MAEIAIDSTRLMVRRIRKILLICNNYDSFSLEEDGRLDEQIVREYSELRLSNPPAIVRVESTIDALKLLLGGNLLGFDSVGEGIGEVDVFNGQADNVDTVAAHFIAELLTDLPVSHQVFSGIFAEYALGDFQHTGGDQLVEVVGTDFLEEVHRGGFVDGVVDAAVDIHLLDVAGEGLGGEGSLLLTVVHQDDLLNGALEMETGFEGHILDTAEGGYDGGVAGGDRGAAGGNDDNQRDDTGHDDEDDLFHGDVSFRCLQFMS